MSFAPRDERLKEAATLIRTAAGVIREQAQKQASQTPAASADEAVRLQKLASIYTQLLYAEMVDNYVKQDLKKQIKE